MTKWLSEEWFEQARSLASDLPARPGCTGRIQQEITGGPDGDVSCYWVLEEGRPTSAAPGVVAAPDITVTLSWSDAATVQRGGLDPSVAFMRGRMKVAGSMDLLIELLSAWRSSEGGDLRSRIAEVSEF